MRNHKSTALRPGSRILVSLLCVGVLQFAQQPRAQPSSSDGQDLSGVLEVMTTEQSIGQTAAGVIKMLRAEGQLDLACYVKGVKLYTEAQASFNGLIARMKSDLVHDHDPSKSSDFQSKLNFAVEARMQFTAFVQRRILTLYQPGERSVLALLASGELLTGVADIITALKGVAFGVWEKYKDASQWRRQQILDELDLLKWEPFGKVPALG